MRSCPIRPKLENVTGQIIGYMIIDMQGAAAVLKNSSRSPLLFFIYRCCILLKLQRIAGQFRTYKIHLVSFDVYVTIITHILIESQTKDG